MLIGRRNLGEHLPWIVATLVVAALSIVWYLAFLAGRTWDLRPKGSEGPLFLFGIAGGLICLFEFLLWPRKKFRVLRLGRAQAWMRAHIWLGLLAVPLLVLHSGFYFRNLEATVLIALFLLVIASGVWGLVVQQFLPQKMLDEVTAETIYSQIPHMSNLLIEEGDRLVAATCGVEDTEPSPLVLAARKEVEALAGAPSDSHFTVGAVRVIGGVHGKVLHSRAVEEPVPNSEALHEFFHGAVAVYLKGGAASGSPLANRARARALFDDVRQRIDPRARAAADSLENLCEQRRQFDRQARLHFWLHNWLWVHLPLSVALILLMFVHVWVTLKYWWPS